MAINTQELFRQKQVQFGAGSSPARFTADFITAFNRSLRDLATRSGVNGTNLTTIADNTDLDDKYEVYLSRILDYNLLILGHNPGLDVRVALMDRMDALRDAQMIARESDINFKGKLDIAS